MQRFFTLFPNNQSLPAWPWPRSLPPVCSSRSRDLVSLSFSCNLSRLYEKNKRGRNFLRSLFPSFFLRKSRISKICRANNLANFHPNKGDKREVGKIRKKGRKKERGIFLFLFLFFFWRRVSKFVENTGGRVVEILNKSRSKLCWNAYDTLSLIQLKRVELEYAQC